MKIFAHTLECEIADEISTEIRFVIASARASGNDLISLKTKEESLDDKISLALIKNLKAIKKEGRIDFYADKSAFFSGKAEASYLLNKFPEITEYIDQVGFLLIIKI